MVFLCLHMSTFFPDRFHHRGRLFWLPSAGRAYCFSFLRITFQRKIVRKPLSSRLSINLYYAKRQFKRIKAEQKLTAPLISLGDVICTHKSLPAVSVLIIAARRVLIALLIVTSSTGACCSPNQRSSTCYVITAHKALEMFDSIIYISLVFAAGYSSFCLLSVFFSFKGWVG